MNDRVYILASEGLSITEIAEELACEFPYPKEALITRLTSKDSLAISYHIGVLTCLEAPEGALYTAAQMGDVDAIELLLKLNKDLKIQAMISERFGR